MTILRSEDVTIFPVSNRNVNSRVFSEENLTKFITTSCDNNSFVKNYNETTFILDFVIDGYSFNVNLKEILDTKKNITLTNLFVHIALKELEYRENTQTYNFYVLHGLDENEQYTGLVFTNEDNPEDVKQITNPFSTIPEVIHRYLRLTDSDGKFINTIRYNSYTIDCIDGGTC